MKTKMKLLDYALMVLFAGAASTGSLYAMNHNNIDDCDDFMSCEIDGEMLFSVDTESETGLFTGGNVINFPNSGMIWITEDSNLGQAELSISAPAYVPFKSGNIEKPVEFYIRSNYSAFVDRYEISIYRGLDKDLVSPIATIPVSVGAVSHVSWDGTLTGRAPFRLNDQLIYVLRAYDKAGTFDETHAQTIQLVTPEDDDRGNVEIRDRVANQLGQPVTKEQALSETLLNSVVRSNNLYRQNIPFYGSRIRIQGNNVPEGTLSINGEMYPVDRNRKFSVDFLVPVGQHQYHVDLRTDQETIAQNLDVDITGNAFFMVGIADVTVFQNSASGAGKMTALTDNQGNERTSDILADGRLAFYLKSQIEGRYTVTAHADTKEQELKHLFSGFGHAYPEDIFRALDPDLYYPTYGDDSSVYRDVDTMGRFYARVDWDKNQALWGNYNTGITGTEFATYSRSLYGGALDLRTSSNTIYGDTKGTLRVFGSQAQTMPGHSEFTGTGGSLYYLRHTRIMPGSDKVQVKVTDPMTGLTQAMVSLERGVDYEVDATQGRIILTRPLLQIVGQYNPSIISEGPLGGFEQSLVVDYEYTPSSFEPKDITRGGRGQYWLGDHVGIGATYVDERQGGMSAYEIQGADVILKAGNGTYLKAEYTHTKNNGVPIFLSDNGGLSFTPIGQLNDDPRQGEAYAFEGRVNLHEQGWTERDTQVGAWHKKTNRGFSNGYSSSLAGREESGVEVSAEITDNFLTYLRHTVAKEGENSLMQSQVTAEIRFENQSTLTGEIKQVETKTGNDKVIGRLAAVKYSHFVTSNLELYGIGQLTVDDDHKRYAKNNLVTLGARYFYGDNSSLNFEGATGSRGHSIQTGIEHKLTTEHTVYANYTYETAKSDYESVFNERQSGLTVGQRWRLTDRLNIFNEVQSLRGAGNERGTSNTTGFDYLLDDGWSTNITYQQSHLKQRNHHEQDDRTNRNAVSASINKTNEIIEYSSKLEYRKDSGLDRRRQWLTTNRLAYKLDDSLRLQGKFNYSQSYDYVNAEQDAKFIDSAIGFAYRPWDNNQWALFGRYNYFFDESSNGQVGYGTAYDQKSHIFSMEGVYKHSAKWEYAVKTAYRKSETKFGALGNIWFDSSALFAATQIRYDLINKWHVLGEYRMLDVKDGGTKSGVLLGVDYDITENFRIGAGYNFTDFSDDLTQQDYRYKGFYLNFVGYF